MIPIRDRNPTRKPPVVNVTIIVLNVVVFLYEWGAGSRVEMLFYDYGVIPRAFFDAVSDGLYARAIIPLFSSMFLHGGVLHIAGNMLYLWIFGDNVEDKMGHGRYIVFYLLCGLAAAGAHLTFDPGSDVPTIGASGAISGVLGAYIVMFPRARVLTVIPIFVFFQVAELPALIVLGLWFLLQFLQVMLSSGVEQSGGTAWWAHIGGFVAGIILVYPFRKYI